MQAKGSRKKNDAVMSWRLYASFAIIEMFPAECVEWSWNFGGI
ncbi:hypothetical protein N9H39_03675 [Gammaproteobacteria bacterium]|jgi:hypothetical protein|nr:hypothetical protein [Gammaproteobacteria bacterium]